MQLFKLYIGLLATITISACENKTTKQANNNSIVQHNQLSEQEKKEGWQLLFDGNSLHGWKKYGGAPAGKAWIIKDSSIYLDASAEKGDWQTNEGGDILYDENFADFHLQYDWKIDSAGNSGLIFYVHEDTSKFKWGWQSGPEMQVLDNAAHPDAKILKHRAGDLYDLVSGSPETVKPALQWNHAAIKSSKGKLEFYLNGSQILSLQLWDDNWKQLIANSKFKDFPGFGTYRSGKISLQDHGNHVWFRNIKVRKL